MSFPTLGRLLIVDDETELLAALCESLADQNYDAIGAPSAEEGLRRVQSERFDLVITDYSMPGMTGGDLARAVRAVAPSMPILIASGYAELPAGLDLDVARLGKPYTQEQLIQEIAKLESQPS